MLRTLYTAPTSTIDQEIEDKYVDGVLSTTIGDEYYPGDSEPSENWPGMPPGENGVNNALSPKYCDLSGIVDIDEKPPVLWIRGAEDQVVSDTSLFDAGYLGQVGQLPDWPGEEAYPPQTRDVLDEYESSGGTYEEVVVDETGHSPHIEKPDVVPEMLTDFLD